MAYSELTVTEAWPDAAHHTASGATACLLTAPGYTKAFYAIAASKPTEATRKFPSIEPGESKAFELADGELLWVATRATGSFTALLHTGAA